MHYCASLACLAEEHASKQGRICAYVYHCFQALHHVTGARLVLWTMNAGSMVCICRRLDPLQRPSAAKS